MYFLGIDVGTSSVKCVLIREDASIAAEASAPVTVYMPKPLFSEEKPAEWWSATMEAFGKLQLKGVDLKEVDAIAMCGQQHGLVAMDRGGNVLRDAILWNDLRTVEECREIIERMGGIDSLVEKTNNGMYPGFTAPKLLWMQKHEPELFGRIFKFVLPKDYISYRLTGDYGTDVVDASGTGLFDVQNKRWSKEAIEKLNLNPGMFPDVVESSQMLGRVRSSAADETGLREGIPVFAGSGDAVCQSAGMGIVTPDALGVVIGTSGVVTATQCNFSVNKGGRLQYFCSCERDTWMTIGCQLNSGASVQWANQNIVCGDTHFEKFNAMASQADPASGVFYLPYIGGERCPHNDANAKGVYFGLDYNTGLGEIARATMEGVTYGLKQIYDLTAACNSEFKPKYIITSGGACRSKLWRQILADIFDMPVYIPKGAEGGGAFGAALLAGIGIGAWKSVAEGVKLVGTESITLPGPDSRIYREMEPIFAGLYDALKPSYQKLAEVREKLEK